MKPAELLWALPIGVVGYIGWIIYQDHAATVAGNAQIAAIENGAAVPADQLALDYTGSGIVSIPGAPANPYTGTVQAQSIYPQLLDPYTQSPGTISELPVP